MRILVLSQEQKGTSTQTTKSTAAQEAEPDTLITQDNSSDSNGLDSSVPAGQGFGSSTRVDAALSEVSSEESGEFDTANSDPALRLLFTVPSFATQPGQQLVVVGSCAQLGAWNAAQGLSLKWHEGHQWNGVLELQQEELQLLETLEFKVNTNTYFHAGAHPN